MQSSVVQIKLDSHQSSSTVYPFSSCSRRFSLIFEKNGVARLSDGDFHLQQRQLTVQR
jgi:hypothetical protein